MSSPRAAARAVDTGYHRRLRAAGLVLGALQITVAAGALALNAARVVHVEEIVLVVLVVLPMAKGEADGTNDTKEHKEEAVVVDTESLASAFATRLVAGQRPKVKASVDTENGLGVRSLGVKRH